MFLKYKYSIATGEFIRCDRERKQTLQFIRHAEKLRGFVKFMLGAVLSCINKVRFHSSLIYSNRLARNCLKVLYLAKKLNR